MKIVLEEQAKATLAGIPTEIKNSLHIYSEKYEIALEYFNQYFSKD